MNENNTTRDPDAFEDPLSNYEPTQYSSALEVALAESPVSLIQSQPFAELEATTPIRRAVQTLHGLRVASLLVVEQGRLVGIFTERDVLERVAEQFSKLADKPIREVMTCDPLVVYASDPAGTALAAIAAAGYRHVPVLDSEGKIRGIVSPRRVFDFLQSQLDNAQ